MRLALLAWASLMVLAIPLLARAQSVDVALVLAIDVSGSVDAAEYQLQTEGIAEALESPEVWGTISRSAGSIAIAVVQWSGKENQDTSIGWTRIETEAQLIALAGRVRKMERKFSDWTGVGAAIRYSVALLDACPYPAIRRVVDVSGDGIDNQGMDTIAARDEAAARGIVVNGLPILTDDPTLDVWYSDNVIGGPGSFIEPARDFRDFGRAILRKITLEVS